MRRGGKLTERETAKAIASNPGLSPTTPDLVEAATHPETIRAVVALLTARGHPRRADLTDKIMVRWSGADFNGKRTPTDFAIEVDLPRSRLSTGRDACHRTPEQGRCPVTAPPVTSSTESNGCSVVLAVPDTSTRLATVIVGAGPHASAVPLGAGGQQVSGTGREQRVVRSFHSPEPPVARVGRSGGAALAAALAER